MLATISIFCMFIHVYDGTYVTPVSLAKWLSVRLRTKWFWVRVQLQSLTHFNHLKPWNFTSSWRMVKNTIKLQKSLFPQKISKKMQRKPGRKCFLHLRVWHHLCWIQNFVILYIRKTDQNTAKLCTRLFLHKILKSMPKKKCEVLASGPLQSKKMQIIQLCTSFLVVITISSSCSVLSIKYFVFPWTEMRWFQLTCFLKKSGNSCYSLLICNVYRPRNFNILRKRNVGSILNSLREPNLKIGSTRKMFYKPEDRFTYCLCR